MFIKSTVLSIRKSIWNVEGVINELRGPTAFLNLVSIIVTWFGSLVPRFRTVPEARVNGCPLEKVNSNDAPTHGVCPDRHLVQSDNQY